MTLKYAAWIPDELAQRIDKMVKDLKDEYNLPVYKSRSDFVRQACKLLLRREGEKRKGRKGG